MFNLFDLEHGVKAGSYTICMYKTMKGDGADFLCISGKDRRVMFDASSLCTIDADENSVSIGTDKESFLFRTKSYKESVAICDVVCKLAFILRSGEKVSVFNIAGIDDMMGVSEKNSDSKAKK